MARLVEASGQEEGIDEEDVLRLERALAVHSTSDVTEHISHLMMAKEELSRARKQLSLQRSMAALTGSTPTWKIRNLIHQATQIGMENYIGIYFGWWRWMMLRVTYMCTAGVMYCHDLIEENEKKLSRKYH